MFGRRAQPQRVLIASSHALFGQGLRSLLQERHRAEVEIVGVVSSLEEVVSALERLKPDLVIVDYDDDNLNRDEFLARYVEGEGKLRVVLLSLQEGQQALVYDRRTLAASKTDDWLQEWTTSKRTVDRTKSGMPLKRNRPALQAIPIVENRRGDMKHLVIAGFLVILVTALLIFGLERVQLLPVAASAQAAPIDSLFDLEFKVIAFLFSLIVVLMLYSVIVFRRRKGDDTDAAHIEGNTRLEVMWTVAPLVTVLVFAYLGGQSLAETMRVEADPLEVNVIGQQWSWRFEYPELGIISSELILQEGQQALLHLSATDVIHSFWVPEFRVKQDALPGGKDFVRDLRITPTMVGEWKVRCAELCGLKHAYMESPVRVLAEAEFTSWVEANSVASGDPVERGQQVYQQFGCNACHSLDGTVSVGPSWQGIYQSQEPLADGTTVTVDEAYLHESIIDPNAKIVAGFNPGVMPQNFEEVLTEEQISDVIEFIKSVR
jgi:cytochrome c oxidase subunit 2